MKLQRISSAWVGHGLWNTAEHLLTRVLDAGTTLLLLWFLPSEQFAKLALAQAWVAPLLLFFVAPETAFYRDYAEWKAEGREKLIRRIRALRKFALGKAQLAIVIAGLMAWLVPGVIQEEGSRSEAFFALIWAFAIVLNPQIAGPDREFLRLDLQLRQLNTLTLFQKLSVFSLTWIAALFFNSQIWALAAGAILGAGISIWSARFLVERSFSDVAGGPVTWGSAYEVVSSALRGFSLWNHLIGVIQGWIQTMDLFFLGLFKFPGTEVGMYGAVLKIANFTLALPLALSNLFLIRLGRTGLSERDASREVRLLSGLSVQLALLVALQASVFWFVSPYALSWIGRGRWGQTDLSIMREWLGWILAGSSILGSSLLWSGWVGLRCDIRRMLTQVSIPWGAVSLLVYGIFTWVDGPMGAARANPIVAALLIPLLLLRTRARMKEAS